MKKTALIIFVNLLIFCILVKTFDIYVHKYYSSFNKVLNIQRNFLDTLMNYSGGMADVLNYDIEQGAPEYLDFDKYRSNFCDEKRTAFGSEGGGNAKAVTLGCSYTYGHGLKKEQTFPYLLSKYINAPVANYAQCGGELVTSINRIIDNDEIKNADYVIYTYMWDHIIRYIDLEFFNEDHNLQFLALNNFERILSKVYMFKLIICTMKLSKFYREYPACDLVSKYLKKIILISYDEIKKLMPDAKFIIILYNEKLSSDLYNYSRIKYGLDIMNSPVWDEIANETDIIIVRTKDVTGFVFDKDYKLKKEIADWHPNEKVWELFTPLFVEKYIK